MRFLFVARMLLGRFVPRSRSHTTCASQTGKKLDCVLRAARATITVRGDWGSTRRRKPCEGTHDGRGLKTDAHTSTESAASCIRDASRIYGTIPHRLRRAAIAIPPGSMRRPAIAMLSVLCTLLSKTRSVLFHQNVISDVSEKYIAIIKVNIQSRREVLYNKGGFYHDGYSSNRYVLRNCILHTIRTVRGLMCQST